MSRGLSLGDSFVRRWRRASAIGSPGSGKAHILGSVPASKCCVLPKFGRRWWVVLLVDPSLRTCSCIRREKIALHTYMCFECVRIFMLPTFVFCCAESS